MFMCAVEPAVDTDSEAGEFNELLTGSGACPKIVRSNRHFVSVAAWDSEETTGTSAQTAEQTVSLEEIAENEADAPRATKITASNMPLNDANTVDKQKDFAPATQQEQRSSPSHSHVSSGLAE